MKGHAQNYYLPISSFYFQDPGMIEPGYFYKDQKLHLSALYNSRTGPYSNIRYQFFNAVANIKQKHNAGIRSYTEKDGDFFSRTRLYGVYVINIHLSKKLDLSAGVQAGFANFSFASSSAGPGGSSWKPDASIGLGITGPRYYLGASVSQITNAELIPIQFKFSLPAYSDWYGKYIFPLGIYFNYKIHARYRIARTPLFQHVHEFSYKEIFNFSIGQIISHGYLFAASYSIRLDKKDSEKINALDIGFQYFTPSSRKVSFLPFSYLDIVLKLRL